MSSGCLFLEGELNTPKLQYIFQTTSIFPSSPSEGCDNLRCFSGVIRHSTLQSQANLFFIVL